MNKGKLFLLPTPISKDQNVTDILLPMYLNSIRSIEYFVVETPKIARSFLKDLPFEKKIQDLHIESLDEHMQKEEIKELITPLLSGNDMALLSDAGIPTVADPGYKLVSLAQKEGVKIVPLIGPSSILLALMASGLNGQSFAFHGYLPKEKGLKRKRIKSLEKVAKNTGQTQIFMETPYKNQHMLEDVLEVCEETSILCIAQNIMSSNEYIITKSIGEWRNESILLDKTPCLFLINT